MENSLYYEHRYGKNASRYLVGWFLFFAFSALAFLLILSTALSPSLNTSANTKNMAGANVGVSVKEFIKLALDTASLDLRDQRGNIVVSPDSSGTLITGSVNAAVTTNVLQGYTLSVLTRDTSTAMTHSNSSITAKIDATASGASALSGNTWGFQKPGDADHWYPIGIAGSSGTLIANKVLDDAAYCADLDYPLNESGCNVNTYDTYSVGFGANLTSSLPAGTYSNNVIFSAIANPDSTRYTLTFDPNGGTGTVAPRTILANSTVDLPTTGFVNRDFSIRGWSLKSNPNSLATPPDPIYTPGTNLAVSTLLSDAEAISGSPVSPGDTLALYAIWSDEVAIQVVGGIIGTSGSTTSGSFKIDQTITLTANPPATGYHFGSWSKTGEGTFSSTTTNPTTFTVGSSDTVITVNNIANTYTVNYAAGNTGATCSVSGTPATYDQDVTLSSSTCTKTGYTQDGWSTDASASTKDYNLGATVTTPNFTATDGGSYTLYPHFTVNSHTVTVNEGTNVTTVSGSGTYNYGATVNISATAFATGYHFGSWTVDAGGISAPSGASTSFTMPDADVVITANAAGNTYTIDYAAGSTGGSCSVSSTSATYGQNVTLSSSTCTKSGYTQDGWSTSSAEDNTKDYDLGQTLTTPNFTATDGGSYTLYPHFIVSLKTVTINKGSYVSTVSGAGSYSYGDTVNISATTSTGYHFNYWYVNSGGISTPSGSSTSFTMPNNDVTLTAYAAANSYTVRYAAGSTGGSCSVSSTSATYNQNVTLSSTRCTKTNYTQSGWSTSTSGSTNNYSLGQTLTAPNFTSVNGGTYTLYPYFVYDPPRYTLTVSNGIIGTSGSTTSGSYTSGSTVTITANSPSSGYAFSSWTSNNGGSFANSSSSSTTFTMPSNSVTVTANYVATTPVCSSTVHPTATTGCKMADGKTWIYGNKGNSAYWSGLFTNATGGSGHDATLVSGKCPSGYSAPKNSDYDTLASSYSSGGLYAALGLSVTRRFWSSTETSSSSSNGLLVKISSAYASNFSRSGNQYYLLCVK